MPNEPRVEGSPCAALQVLESKVKDLDRRFDEHSRVQNAHLVTIANKLDGLAKANTDGREERSEQIGDLRTEVVERFNKMLLAAIGFGVPVMAGLLYLILNQAMKMP